MSSQIIIIYIALTVFVVAVISVALVYIHFYITDYKYYKKKSLLQQDILSEMRVKMDKVEKDNRENKNVKESLIHYRMKLNDCNEEIRVLKSKSFNIENEVESKYRDRYNDIIKKETGEKERYIKELKDVRKEYEEHIKINNYMAMEIASLKSSKNK